MIAIYGFIDENNAVWGVVALLTIDEYLNSTGLPNGEYVTVSKL